VRGTLLNMRWLLCALAAVQLAACKGRPSAGEIADRGWRAHELVVAAGEHAATCAEAGPAMQRLFDDNRQAFVDAVALDHDPNKLSEAADYMEAHHSRYADLETRMTALSDRCADDAAVTAVFDAMDAP
jgi:hypothetical protein